MNKILFLRDLLSELRLFESAWMVRAILLSLFVFTISLILIPRRLPIPDKFELQLLRSVFQFEGEQSKISLALLIIRIKLLDFIPYLGIFSALWGNIRLLASVWPGSHPFIIELSLSGFLNFLVFWFLIPVHKSTLVDSTMRWVTISIDCLVALAILILACSIARNARMKGETILNYRYYRWLLMGTGFTFCALLVSLSSNAKNPLW